MDAEAEGFAQFVEARQRALQRTAWLLTGDWALAEDLVQTALVRSWPRWERIRRRDDPGADDHNRELLTIRHYSLYAPRDFDISPYFQVVKPSIEHGVAYRSTEPKAARIASSERSHSSTGTPISVEPTLTPEPMIR